MNRWHARRAARNSQPVQFALRPEPRLIGSVPRGRQLVAGEVLFAGHLIAVPGDDPWSLMPPSPEFDDARHGFAWLDDLAALADEQAQRLAGIWVQRWIDLYGWGTGPGWTPQLAGRRIVRMINHADLIMEREPSTGSDAFLRCLAAQEAFLGRRWKAAPAGLPRLEALVGLILADLSFRARPAHLSGALDALSVTVRSMVGHDAAMPERNPEALLDIFALLAMVAQVVADTGHPPNPDLQGVLARMALILRDLRHADGGLARFHGGGRGTDARFNLALAASGSRTPAAGDRAMGFARLNAGRTTVIADAAMPPTGAVSANAHASALAFELTSGRRPLIVSCGPGAAFGESWHHAGRLTASHSTITLADVSSATLQQTKTEPTQTQEWLVDGPNWVECEMASGDRAMLVEMRHDGYAASHGVVHHRRLTLMRDGRQLFGEDVLEAVGSDERKDETHATVPFVARFHLHPDVEAEADADAGSVLLRLKSGEVWEFRPDGTGQVTLEPSIFLEPGRLKPHATKQIAIKGRTEGPATRLNWTLAKSQDTPQAIRDVVREGDDQLPID